MSSVAPTKRYCPSCGTPTFDAGQRFCASCGALLSSATSAADAGTGRAGRGLDGAVNSYIEDRVRDSSAVLVQQVKQELAQQARRTAQTQLRRNGGKIALYAGVGVAGLIVISSVVSLLTGLLLHLLPFALLVIAAYVAYLGVTGRLRRR